MKHLNYALDRIPAAMLGMAIAFLLKTDAPHDRWYYFAWSIAAIWTFAIFGGSEWLNGKMDELVDRIRDRK